MAIENIIDYINNMNTYIVNFYTDTGVTGYYLVNAECEHSAKSLVEFSCKKEYPSLDIIISNIVRTVKNICTEKGIIESNITNVGLGAYELYKSKGGTLTEEEWLASLKGDKGDIGEKGADGLPATTYQILANQNIALEYEPIEPISFILNKIEGDTITTLSWEDINKEEIIYNSNSDYIKWNDSFQGIDFGTDTPRKGIYSIQLYKNSILIASLSFAVIEKGAEGLSIYTQYSKDKLEWHDTYVKGDIYIRFGREGYWGTGIKFIGDKGETGYGANGQNACALSLSNTNDVILCDEKGNPRNKIISYITFTEGLNKITPSPDSNLKFYSSYGDIIKVDSVKGYYVEVINISSEKVVIPINASYKGTIYTKDITIVKKIDNIKYSIEVDTSNIIYNETTKNYNIEELNIQIKKENYEDNSFSFIESATDLDTSNLVVRINGIEQTDAEFKDSYIKIKDFNIDETSSYNIILFNKQKNSIEDSEIITFTKIKNGASAYDSYINNGGTLTEEEWLESLKGANGNTYRTLLWEEVEVGTTLYSKEEPNPLGFIDVVIDFDNNKWLCIKNYIKEEYSQPNELSEYFILFNEYQNVATKILFAKDGTIDDLTLNNARAYKKDEYGNWDLEHPTVKIDGNTGQLIAEGAILKNAKIEGTIEASIFKHSDTEIKKYYYNSADNKIYSNEDHSGNPYEGIYEPIVNYDNHNILLVSPFKGDTVYVSDSNEYFLASFTDKNEASYQKRQEQEGKTITFIANSPTYPSYIMGVYINTQNIQKFLEEYIYAPYLDLFQSKIFLQPINKIKLSQGSITLQYRNGMWIVTNVMGEHECKGQFEAKIYNGVDKNFITQDGNIPLYLSSLGVSQASLMEIYLKVITNKYF